MEAIVYLTGFFTVEKTSDYRLKSSPVYFNFRLAACA
jgi:hypothetical protein